MPAMQPLTVNASDLDIMRMRESLLEWAGGIDAKRPTAWAQYGWPQTVTFEQLLQAYERTGPGNGAVHRILDKCWEGRPRIKQKGADAVTPWETKVSDLLDGIEAWQKLRDFDRRNMVGTYAALVYRVKDGKQLREPMARASELVDIVPLFENQIRVVDWHTDQSDTDNFGKPKMFQMVSRRPQAGASTQAQPIDMVDVHPSRVQILAEGSVGDNFLEGVPLLRAGFNHLVDIEKISGGSAESYLKNSARSITINFDANASPTVITQNSDGTPSGKTVREVLSEQVDRLNRNSDSALVTQGATAGVLQTHISDPESAFMTAANLFAASVRLPFTILFGQQTGRLASDEDRDDYIARAVSRQLNELTPMLRQFVRRMQAAGILEAGDFEIEWPPLDAPGDDAKFGQLGKLTAAMQQAQASGLSEPLFDANELRGVAGFEKRDDDGMPNEGGDPTDPADPNADPAAPPKA